MQNSQRHIVHIYDLDDSYEINEQQLKRNIIKALQTYLQKQSLDSSDIKIGRKNNRCQAYVSVKIQIAEKLDKLDELSIAGKKAKINRYYYDYQIYINKLDNSVTRQNIIDYLSQFGKIIDCVITSASEKNSQCHFNHCYVKVQNQEIINSIILKKFHTIGTSDFRAVRTYGLQEDKQTDKKLFLIVIGNVSSEQSFEKDAGQYFSSYGSLRERPKIEEIAPNKSKMIISYTSPKPAAQALKQFNQTEWYKSLCDRKLLPKLSYFFTKQNKIFVRGLKNNVNQKELEQTFKIFGYITELSIIKNSRPEYGLNAIIGYKDEKGYKLALANYFYEPKIKLLFIKKPYATVFLAPQDKRSYNEMKSKPNIKPANNVPPTLPNMMGGGYPGQMGQWHPNQGQMGQMSQMGQMGYQMGQTAPRMMGPGINHGHNIQNNAYQQRSDNTNYLPQYKSKIGNNKMVVTNQPKKE